MAVETTQHNLLDPVQGQGQAQAIWTQELGLDQVAGEGHQQQHKEISEQESHSFFIEHVEGKLLANSNISPTKKKLYEPKLKENTSINIKTTDGIPILDAVNIASAQSKGAPKVFNVTNVDVMFLATNTNPSLNVEPPMLPQTSNKKTSKLKCDQHTIRCPEDDSVHSNPAQEEDDHCKDQAVVTIEHEKQPDKITSIFRSAKFTIFSHVNKNQCKSDKKKRKRRPPIASRKVVYYTKEMGYYRQCFQPRFEYPHSCAEFLTCKGADFLIVFVGLCNILLLQFILVVLMFFSQEEINQDTFKENSYSYSHSFGKPW